jgi:hypothetical protein
MAKSLWFRVERVRILRTLFSSLLGGLIRMRRPVLILILLFVVASQIGCVRRRMTIRSNPPGALVTVDNQEVGVTPVSVPYIYYGTREIRLELDGFETVVEKHNFFPPWYQYPGLDFVSENLVPYEIRDERILNFDMAPQRIVPIEEVLARAENLRSNTRLGLATPAAVPFGGSTAAPLPYIPPARAVDVNRPEFLPPGGAALPTPDPGFVEPFAPQRLPYGGYVPGQ